MWFLGMDVGTGGTRAVVVDADGKLISGASSEHAPFRTPHPGWAEQDPEDWWRAAQEAIKLALAAAPEPHQPIAGIGLTGQMHGAVMLDENGAVLRPSLIWCDTRTQPECDWLHEKIGYEKLIELTCNPALPNFTLTKLLWVKTHEPEIFAKIRHIMCPKDYVRYRLTGEFAIDVQEASGTLLLDVTHRRWSKEVAEAAGIPESWLPKVYESPEVCARISETAAGLTGLRLARQSLRELATRARARWAWAFCSPGLCRRRSARPAWCLRRRRNRRRIPRDACTRSAMLCRVCGT